MLAARTQASNSSEIFQQRAFFTNPDSISSSLRCRSSLIRAMDVMRTSKDDQLWEWKLDLSKTSFLIVSSSLLQILQGGRETCLYFIFICLCTAAQII